VQDNASLELLRKIKISNVIVSGDTRFDRVIAVAQQKIPLPVAGTFSEGHKVIVAGSTWEKDEELLQKALSLLPEHWKLILVPHEINVDHIRFIERLFEGSITKWSSLPAADSSVRIEKRVLLIDKVGFLAHLYRYGNVAWIGGGFGKEGVHNVLEAAVYGMPCFYGPIFYQFNEAVELIKNGGAFTISDARELTDTLEQLEDSMRYTQHAIAAREYVYEHGGATALVLQYFEELGIEG
jgi:3-deoxy-D-manno-octulosonic-acid transferase